MEIIYEDNHIIAVNKAVSEISQSDRTGDISLDSQIKEYIKVKYKKPGDVFLGVIHRIDRPVSGVVLYARTSKALTRLNEMFREKNIEKTYLAVVRNFPPKHKDTLTHFIVRNTKTNKSIAYEKEVKNSKKAVMSYELLSEAGKCFILKIVIETGRHHQIRCQLARIGSPIVGDHKYGYPTSNPGAGINLHSFKMSFIHPVTKEKIEIKAPLPTNDKLWNLFHVKDL